VRLVVVGRRAATMAACAAMLLPGCAATTYDASLEPAPAVPGSAGSTSTTVAADAPLGELLAELRSSMRSLDEQVVEGDGDDDTLARIDAIWHVA
jgi:hypothetical protein